MTPTFRGIPMSASPLIDRRLTRVTKVSSGLAALTALALLGGTVPPAVGQRLDRSREAHRGGGPALGRPGGGGSLAFHSDADPGDLAEPGGGVANALSLIHI